MRALLACALVAASATATLAASLAPQARLGFTSRYQPGRGRLPRGALVELGRPGNKTAHMTAAQYQDLSLAIRTILKRYPADKHYFIGTGRDPAPLVAALELLGGRPMAMTFPASHIVSDDHDTITPELIGRYFERLIPDAQMREQILHGRRKLVLLDQTRTGKTPNSLAPFIQAYLDRIGSRAEIVKLAIAPRGSSLYAGVQRISTQRFSDVGEYLTYPYEGVVSEFPRHLIGTHPISALRPRAAYGKFKAAMLERMKRDRELDRFLHTEGGPAFAAER
jgi:hypothetical protein